MLEVQLLFLTIMMCQSFHTARGEHCVFSIHILLLFPAHSMAFIQKANECLTEIRTLSTFLGEENPPGNSLIGWNCLHKLYQCSFKETLCMARELKSGRVRGAGSNLCLSVVWGLIFLPIHRRDGEMTETLTQQCKWSHRMYLLESWP